MRELDMLRISLTQQGATTTVGVEGRLAGPSVDELRQVLESLGAGTPRLALDLTGVGFVDAEGEALLRRWLGLGAELSDASAFVAALLVGYDEVGGA
jgi:hypothetical protein